MKLPPPKHSIANTIDQWFEDNREDGHRPHMGASLIGEKCERKLWLIFRWAMDEQFPGRILRLFERGQEEELKVVRNLERIGFELKHTGDDQYRVNLGSHVSGSIDGIIVNGMKKQHILEIKTHSKKSFDKLEKEGVFKSKPLHWFQMQVYMYGTGIDRALYYSVCKDDDRIYTERVKLDAEVAEHCIERAQRIATQDELPPPITTNKTWWECKFCNFHGFCHGEEKITNKNCRTCALSTSKDDSTWFCEKHLDSIPENTQPYGCDSHEMHDHLREEK